MDTCSWLKLDLLAGSGWNSLVEIIFRDLDIFITHEVFEEVKNFLPNREEWIKMVNIRTTDRSRYYRSIGEIFDPADASLLSFHSNMNVIIITEDPAILAEGISQRQNIIQLIDLISLIYESEKIVQGDFRKIIAFFRKKRNITKKKELSLKKTL